MTKFFWLSVAAAASGTIGFSASIWTAIASVGVQDVISGETLIPVAVAIVGLATAIRLTWVARGMWHDMMESQRESKRKVSAIESDMVQALAKVEKQLAGQSKQLSSLQADLEMLRRQVEA